MAEVEELANRDPEDLLPEDRHWLDVDFSALGDGSAKDRCLWAAELDSALAAAKHVARGSTQTLRSRYGQGPVYDTRSTSVEAVVDTEGSIRWKRRRRRVK